MKKYVRFVLVGMVLLGGCSMDKTEKKNEAKEAAVEQARDNWKNKIHEIVGSNETIPDKFSAVMVLARMYTPTSGELKSFEKDIVEAFKTRTYLQKGEEYTLTYAFEAAVIDKQYNDQDKKAIDTFAISFLKNIKSVYREAESINSPGVKIRGDQMNQLLDSL